MLPVEKLLEELPAPDEENLAAEIAALGYPKLAHLKKKTSGKNPAEVLLTALGAEDLDSRLVEALPWLAFEFADLDWKEAIKDCEDQRSAEPSGFHRQRRAKIV